MGTGVEQKAVGVPEEVVDDCDVGCMQETFNTRNESHSQFIITGLVVAPEVMAIQLQLCGALVMGGMFAGSSRNPVYLFFQWILIGSSVHKEAEGTDSFQVMQYMIYVNLGICKKNSELWKICVTVSTGAATVL